MTMEIGYPYSSDISSYIRRSHDFLPPATNLISPHSMARSAYLNRTNLTLSCLSSLPRGIRTLEEPQWLHSPLPVSLTSSHIPSKQPPEPYGVIEDKETDYKLKFGVENILSSEFGKRKKQLVNKQIWWQSPAAAVYVPPPDMGFTSSLHIPTDSTYAYPSIITPPHMETSGTAALPHYTMDKCYGYLASSYAHMKQADIMSSHEFSYKGVPRRKKTWSRAVFTSLQRRGLEKRFELQKYVNKPDRKQLASALGLTDSQVKVWFQNRRMKWRHSQRIRKQQEKAFPNSPHPDLQE